jgi:hypothetical protein
MLELIDTKTGKNIELVEIEQWKPASVKQSEKAAGAKYILVRPYGLGLPLWVIRILVAAKLQGKIIGYTTYQSTTWGIWDSSEFPKSNPYRDDAQ